MTYPTNPSSRVKLTTGHRKLGEVCDILDNLRKPVTRRDRNHGPYPYYGATGIQDYVSGYIFDEDLILVGEDGARWGAGEHSAYKISGKSWVNNHAHVLRPNRGIVLDDWIVHFLNISDLSEYITGTTVKKLNQAKLKSIPIPLPPIPEQKKIVAKLERVLGKISEAKKLRAEAQEAAQNLLPAELHKIFSQQHSNILENVRMSSTGQKDWQEKELKEVVEQKTLKNTKEDLPFVGMEDVESETGKFLGSLEPKSVKSATFYFNKESVLYGKLRPYLNKVLLPDFEGHCSTEFIPLKPKGEVLRGWLAYWLKSPQIVERAMSTNTGSRMPRTNMKDLMKIKIPLPPLAEQKKIVARLDSLSQKIQAVKELQNTTAADFSALQQSVLYQAFFNTF